VTLALALTPTLTLTKVAAYIAHRLPNVDDPAALEQSLELLCNDKPLPMDMSLASVRVRVTVRVRVRVRDTVRFRVRVRAG